MLAAALAASLVFSPAQCANLELARRVGAEYDLAQTLPAVMYVESSAGVNLVGDDGTSFGVAQMQVPTAKVVLRRWPHLWRFKEKQTDGAVVRRLLQDKEWALQMAARHLADLRDTYGYRRALESYNAGPAGMQKGFGIKYANKVIKHLGVRCAATK